MAKSSGVPIVTGISPSSGPVAGGASVRVTGSGFTGATKVSFGTAAAAGVTVLSDTQLTVTAPPGAAGAVDVTVSTPAGTSAITPADQFTYHGFSDEMTTGPPVVTGISPYSGPVAGGASVRVTGSGFTGATKVSFGTVAAAGVTVLSDTRLTVTAPPGAAGAVDVTVSTPAGTSAITSADQFTYLGLPAAQVVTGVDPASGLPVSGETVPVTDSDVTDATKVSFGALGPMQAFDSGIAVTALAVRELDGQPTTVAGGEDGGLSVWGLSTGGRRGLPPRTPGRSGASVWGVALGKLDGKAIAVSGDIDGAVRVWDIDSGDMAGSPITGHTAAVNSVALGMLDDRVVIVSASDDYTLRTWDAASGRSISEMTNHENWVNGVALGELDGRPIAVSASSDRTVRVWDLASGRQLSSMTGHDDEVSSVALGVLGGKPIAVSGSKDQTVRVWDLATGRQISQMTGHTGSVRAVTVGAVAGRPVAVSGGNDQTVRAWDLADGTPFGNIMAGHTGPVRAVGFLIVDGRATIVSGSDDGTIRRWIPQTRDQVEWLSDAPAAADLLHRLPLAQALAARLRRFHEETPGTSFLVHIDGPWGSGKSTLINLLRSELADDWLTVDFNAWRQSRIGPPWWALLAALRLDLGRQLSAPRRIWLRLAESWARVRRAGAPYAFAIFLLLALATVIILLLRPVKLTLSGARDIAEVVIAAVTLLGTLWAGALLAGRFLLWDSARGARLFEQSNTNPMQDVADHFGWLIGRLRRPVLFFIDDLDRCAEAYVVEFLETIQTLMRDSPRGTGKNSSADETAASFIIAADGEWIRQSYEVAYTKFESSISEPGRPLGYLFLDKLFQLRVPLPTIDSHTQHRYLSALLRVRGSDEVTQRVAAEEQSVRDRIQQSSTATEVTDAVNRASPEVRALVAPDAVKKLTTPEVATATEHELQRFSSLLAANPRSMKRFVNDYSILLAIRTLEGNSVQLQPLALWAILETQWPALADLLRAWPDGIRQINGSVDDPGDPPISVRPLLERLRPLLNDPNVRRVTTFAYGGPLTADLIRSCSGTVSPPSTH